MSAILETRPTIEKVFPQIDYRPPHIPSTPALIDQSSLKSSELKNTQPWEESTFNDLLGSMQENGISSVGAFTEAARQAIDERKLARALNCITNLEERDELKAKARGILMGTYIKTLNENGMGPNSYDAVTHFSTEFRSARSAPEVILFDRGTLPPNESVEE